MSDYIVDSIGAYHQGVAIFKSGDKYGVMLTGGNVLLHPKYDYITPFNNGYAQAIRNGLCVVIDFSGKEYKTFGETLVPLLAEYDMVRDFHDGLACVQKGNKWGAINMHGQEVISLLYEYISDFESGVAKCIKEVQRQGYANPWGFINSYGEFFDLDYSEPILGIDGYVTFIKSGSLIIGKNGHPTRHIDGTSAEIRVNHKGYYALRNGDQTIILNARFIDYNIARDYSCGLACVQKNDGYWGAIDVKGNIVIPFEYLSIGDFKENRSFAKDRNGTIVLISEKGRIIKELDTITDNESFTNGVAIVYKETSDNHWRYPHGSCGLINLNGDLILDMFEGVIVATKDPSVFTLISKQSSAKNGKEDKVGYFNSSTGLLVKPQYDAIVRLEKDYVIVKALSLSECKLTLDGRPFVFNGDERILLPDWCIGGEDFKDGICKALSSDKKWGLVDKDGNTICEPLFESIGEVKGEYVITIGSRVIKKKDSNSWLGTKNETVVTYGLVNLANKVSIWPKYDKVPEWNGSFYEVVLDNLWGILDAQGKVVSQPKYRTLVKFDNYYLYTKQVESSRYYYEDLYGLLDKNGTEIVAPKYKEIKLLKSGYFKGKTIEKRIHEKWYLLNECGQLTKHSYDDISLDESGFFKFKISDREGLFDLDGNIMVRKSNGCLVSVPSQFEWCSDFKDGHATVLYHKCENFVDEEFNIILIHNNKHVYPDVSIDYVTGKDPEGNITYKSNRNVGLLSPDGKSLIPAEYESIIYLSKGHYVAAKGFFPRYYGMINIDGSIVLPFEFTKIAPLQGVIQNKVQLGYNDYDDDYEYEETESVDIEENPDGEFWYFSRSGENYESVYYGLIGLNGAVVLEANYEGIQKSSFGFFLKEGGKWKAYNRELMPLGDEGYDSVSKTETGFYIVTNIEKSWNSSIKTLGVLDPDGNVKLAPIYGSIGEFDSGKLPEGFALISEPGFQALFGVINKEYDIILKPQFTHISDFKDGFCTTIKRINGIETKGVIDVDGNYTDLTPSTTSPQEEKTVEVVMQLENGLTIIKAIEVGSSASLFSIKDSSGNVLLPFKYHGIELLDNGQYRVQVNPSPSTFGYGLRFGILNQNLEEIIKPIYYKIEAYSEYYIISNGSNYGVVDTNGTIIIPSKYRKISKAADNLFWLYTNEESTYGSSSNKGLYGLANAKGEIILPPQYAEVKRFQDGLACVLGGGHWSWDDDDRSYIYYGGHWGVINLEGDEVIPLLYDSMEYEQDSSLFKVSKSINFYNPKTYSFSKNVFGFINKDGERMVRGVNGIYIKSDPCYDWQDDYENGVSSVYYSNQVGKINEEGQFLVHYKEGEKTVDVYLPSEFLWGFDSDTDYIVVVKDGKKGLYSITDNKVLIEPQYDDLAPLSQESFADGLYKCTTNLPSELQSAYCAKNVRIGLVNINGETIVPQEYINIEKLGFSLVAVQRDDAQYQVFDTEQLNLLPDIYDRVLKFGERDNDNYYWSDEKIIKHCRLAIVKRGNKYGAINDLGELVIPVECSSLSLKESNILESNGFLLDSLGRVVVTNGHFTVPLIGNYETASLLENNLIIAKQNSLCGCIRLNGQTIIPFAYDSIKLAGANFIVSQKNKDNDTSEYGVIDIKRRNIIPFVNVDDIEYNEGLFTYKKDNKYGVFSKEGELIAEILYDKVERLSDYLIKVGEYDVEYDVRGDWYSERKVIRWGLISHTGEEILSCKFNEIEPYEKSFYIIKQHNCFGLLDATGKIILEPKYYEIGEFDDSFSIVKGPITIFNKNGEEVKKKAYGVIDGSMNEVIPCCFSQLEYDKELRKFKTDKGYKLIDGRFVCTTNDKRILIPSKYVYCKDFVDNRAISVLYNNPGFKYGLIDKAAKDILPPIFDSILRLDNGLYRFKLNDLYGIVDKDGKIILDNKYSYIGQFEGDSVLICTNLKISNERNDRKRYGLCNDNGEILLPSEYEFIGKESEGFRNVMKNGLWYLYRVESQGLTIVPNITYLGFSHNNRFLVNIGGEFIPGQKKKARGGRWGYVDDHARFVIEPVYDDASRFKENRALVKFNGKWGVIDICGNVVIPFEYDNVYSDLENEHFELCANGIVYVFTLDGEEVNSFDYPKSNRDDYYDYQDDTNWEEETWYALTGGQYGDYPGGDIDYDFLGL